ncbi:glycine oxidase ThiO [Nitrincola alkalilacustris]|uniref:glycine oxidase ThiO n=1 Tax=Nitrincola alkalilacustris TaxID=1571224 RepID=UPI00124CA323|nr:glycine oxidase ThiO [Nitrincola alkalilacustris]
MSDILIAGGGVIGLMLARELAQAGASVTLVERGRCARESSWAGGGIVSPLYPWRYSDPVTRLATWSQTSYVHLAQELFAETGCDPELRQKGMLMVSVHDENQALNWAGTWHRPLMRVDSSFIYAREPNLAPGFESALWMPEVGSIRNPRLGRALRTSVEQHPLIQLHEETEVTGFVLQGERICGVRTPHGNIEADQTVVAGGAWSSGLLASLGMKIQVEPVKGQMMIFNAPVGLIDRVVMLDGRYLIPRNDGQILIGSTLEHVGFDKRATEEARDALHHSALSIVPALEQCPIAHHWAGLRPGTPDGIPYIGAVPGVEGLHLNCGHFRNGLVLAPASTRLHADLLLGRPPVIDPQAYSPAGRLEAL